MELALSGSYHVANALAAATTAGVLGVDEDTVVRGLARARPVPGRFEVVEAPVPFTIVVDYAHTPDGLAVALASARSLAGGARVLCVFGCGGDRDRAKRPLMGAVVSGAADVSVVTSDNPRHEDPGAIIDEVMSGVVAGAEVDRRKGPGPGHRAGPRGRPDRATWCCWPARVTRRSSRSATGRSPSTIARWRRPVPDGWTPGDWAGGRG